MSEQHQSAQTPEAISGYEICVKGRLDARWADWFAGLTFTHTADGTTVLCGPVTDQAALHSLLRKVRDLGLPLISVRPLD
ncbi:MAG: hypothetical protein JWQ08_1275 [Deinococcus sp.]|nr:hypothetical protein [Deinococcus sp.]